MIVNDGLLLMIIFYFLFWVVFCSCVGSGGDGDVADNLITVAINHDLLFMQNANYIGLLIYLGCRYSRINMGTGAKE